MICGDCPSFWVRQSFSHVAMTKLYLNGTAILDEIILGWKSSFVTSFPELVTSLKGYTCVVLSLIVGVNRLYFGSMDKTARILCCDSHLLISSKIEIVVTTISTCCLEAKAKPPVLIVQLNVIHMLADLNVSVKRPEVVDVILPLFIKSL
ncbi:unnamed protein product [Ilex paraguariensis]|uniref:PI4-kinase N-terminal domain-containing protein n=1 Tax=Ilex paraguariensis TaxID=185542 RepID=A0ABC8S5P7_9AQUA